MTIILLRIFKYEGLIIADFTILGDHRSWC